MWCWTKLAGEDGETARGGLASTLDLGELQINLVLDEMHGTIRLKRENTGLGRTDWKMGFWRESPYEIASATLQ